MKQIPYKTRLMNFEREKQKLYAQNLTYKQFEQAVKELADKYKI